MAKQKRKRLWLTVTEEQFYHLELAAERQGLTLSEFLRTLAVKEARKTMVG